MPGATAEARDYQRRIMNETDDDVRDEEPCAACSSARRRHRDGGDHDRLRHKRSWWRDPMFASTEDRTSGAGGGPLQRIPVIVAVTVCAPHAGATLAILARCTTRPYD